MSDLMRTIDRVRRAMPRNVDVMAVCDALEKLMQARVRTTKLTRAEIQRRYRLRKKAREVAA
jgi:hypothetical protein